jgi:hypothetical protein
MRDSAQPHRLKRFHGDFDDQDCKNGNYVSGLSVDSPFVAAENNALTNNKDYEQSVDRARHRHHGAGGGPPWRRGRVRGCHG